jgi:hypothetical protein
MNFHMQPFFYFLWNIYPQILKEYIGKVDLGVVFICVRGEGIILLI